MLKDPVCGKRMRRNHAHVRITYERVTYYLCCPRCQAEFEAAPERYAQPDLGEKASPPAGQTPRRQLKGQYIFDLRFWVYDCRSPR